MEQRYSDEVVVVEVGRDTGHDFYRYTAMIQTGARQGQDCYIIHRTRRKLKGNIVVRLGGPCHHPECNFVPELENFAYFLTTRIPDDFESAPLDEVLMHGVWKKNMERGYEWVPSLVRVRDFYNVGFLVHYMYVFEKKGRPQAYSVLNRKRELMRHSEGNVPRGLGSAVMKYLRKMNNWQKKTGLASPRLIIARDSDLLAERLERVMEKEPHIKLRLEPAK
ncbi:hypothetical protein KY328_03915 [Candidatus Woesearchaeota archaeon]|nr:hypothetical protein [Candidatus Woesearchaeota archaeon]MBW3022043.1 hypothetical protein [Candidatus Woesearchaeota archaeon]